MKIMKIRRVGNSNVVSLPHELEQHGYTPGQLVIIEALPTGELRIIPTPYLPELLEYTQAAVLASRETES